MELPVSQLGADAWQLESTGVSRLLAKIRAAGVPLADFAGVKPYRGVVTGCNDAFLVDTATKEAIVKRDPNAAGIIKPYLRGQDVERWQSEWAGLTSEEVALMWQTAPPRMPVLGPPPTDYTDNRGHST